MTGCSNCDKDVWTRPYELENGLLVFVCDSCGHAEVDNTTAEGVEMHVYEVYRDDKGRFIGDGND